MRVTIRNYKSIRQASIELRPGLNILIGPNGSGKTCLLSGMQFVRDIFRVGAAQALALQGGARRVFRHRRTEMSFSFTHSYGDRTYRKSKIPCQLSWEVTIAQAGTEKLATITRESIEIISRLRKGTTRLFSIVVDRTDGGRARLRTRLASEEEFGRDLFSAWEAFPKRTGNRALAKMLRGDIIASIRKALKDEPDRSCVPMLVELDRVLDEVHTSFQFLREYNILPEIARASTEQLPFAQMAPNGQGVSEVLDALEKRRYDKLERPALDETEAFYFLRRRHFPYWWKHRRFYRPHGRWHYRDALESINRELAAAVGPITHVSVGTDEGSGRRFVRFHSKNDTFSPEEVSDGTVKWLCILVSLFVPFSRVYLLEEPENFLHPWMQQRLISIMRNQAEKNKTIFLLASHSATILNAATPEEILIVKQGRRGTEVSAMGDLESIKRVLTESEFHLGDLWVSGAIGGVPADG